MFVVLLQRPSKHLWANGLILVALSLAPFASSALRADTTFDSGTTTISTGTDFGENLYVGYSGTAKMQVVMGGSGTSTYGFVGHDPGSDGAVAVTSGTWSTVLDLHVGYNGQGAVDVAGGLAYTGGSTFLGSGSQAAGIASVTSGTLWINRLFVGYRGAGEIHVYGGQIQSGLYLGVGEYGHGRLDMSGGAMTVLDCGLGGQGGLGAATITGGTFTIWNGLYVGNYASGTLTIAGGLVTNYGCALGYMAQSSGRVTVTGGTWTSGGPLSVGFSGTGTLDVAGGNVTSGASYIGGWSQDSRGAVTVSSGTWAANGDLSVGVTEEPGSAGTLTMSGGLVTVGGTLSRGTYGTINLDAGGTLQIGSGGTTGWLGVSTLANNGTLIVDRSNASAFVGSLSGSGTLLKRGGGMLTLSGSSTITGSTGVERGTLQIGHSAALAGSAVSPLVGGTLALTPALQATIGGLTPLSGGLVDVGNGSVTVASGLSSTDLVAAIVAGRGDGSWSGTTGITSSVVASEVASSQLRSVGWLDDGFGRMNFAYAAPGDTNLDWVVDVLDAANLAASNKYNTGLPAWWSEGDFNYDGVVDILDVSDFIAAGLYNGGPYNSSVESIAPEPGMLWAAAVAGFGGAVVAAARRRREGENPAGVGSLVTKDPFFTASSRPVVRPPSHVCP